MQHGKKGNILGVKIKRQDLVNLITAPISSQVNKNSAQILEKVAALQEAVDTIARQIARKVSERAGA